MSASIKLSVVLPVSAKKLYKAWLSTKEHSAFTGGEAAVSPRLGGRYSAWDGYIQGKTLELEPYKRIVQAWRTSDFPENSIDSKLELILQEGKFGTKLILVHTDIPVGQGKEYRKGWNDFYFKPMKEYFGRKTIKTGN